ncbi:MAG: hypothetical protein B7Z06_07805 [Flavobacteriales bacterium 32-35-8]|nr:MAG: hypothetical protein B7Z06_07805 [Flavobacteriales bacterium 32-35-8]
MKTSKLHLILVLLLGSYLSISCSSEDNNSSDSDPNPDPVVENIESKTPKEGIRLNWNYSSQTKISSGIYSRVIQLNDNSLMAVYEVAGNVAVRKSTDLGVTWSAEKIVFSKVNGVNMATPDILQLDDNSILICYNPRPSNTNTDTSKKFAIKTIKSYDGGVTWIDDRLLFEASYSFEDGCWEPAAIQLPNGEIQLFFSNESIYTSSNEQNISILRSQDRGLTWTTTPQPISFRIGKRDGMPSPIILNNTEDIVFSIEDNFTQTFKPYTIRSSISENWPSVIDGSSSKRDYALLEPIANNIYAGAPYLDQLSTGETILSYQGAENRAGNDLQHSVMKVTIGDNNAYNFTKKTEPFNIPSNFSGLWNSVSVLNDDTVIAVTSTHGLSSANQSEVWMIKGHVIPEINANNVTIAVDGNENESIWNTPLPIFIGHKSNTRLRANIFYDNENLYLVSKITDTNVVSQAGTIESNDGTIWYLDPTNRSLVAPGKNIYKLFLSSGNKMVLYQGNNKVWEQVNGNTGITLATKITGSGYTQEIAIPWDLMGGKPALNSRIGFNLELSEKGNGNYIDGISNNISYESYTWSTLKLK